MLAIPGEGISADCKGAILAVFIWQNAGARGKNNTAHSCAIKKSINAHILTSESRSAYSPDQKAYFRKLNRRPYYPYMKRSPGRELELFAGWGVIMGDL